MPAQQKLQVVAAKAKLVVYLPHGAEPEVFQLYGWVSKAAQDVLMIGDPTRRDPQLYAAAKADFLPALETLYDERRPRGWACVACGRHGYGDEMSCIALVTYGIEPGADNKGDLTATRKLWTTCKLQKGNGCYERALELRAEAMGSVASPHKSDGHWRPCLYENCPRVTIKATADFQRCSRCKVAIYCSKECQKGDWLRHKDHCAPPLPK